MAYLKVQTSNSSYSFLVTNAAPAKPYLPIISGTVTSYLPLVTTASAHAGMKLQVVSGGSSYRNMFQDNKSSGTTWNTTTNAANTKLSSTTALTKATTTGTKWATGTSTTGTKWATGTSTTATKYATGTSTTATKYATGTSTTATKYATGTSTTGTSFATGTVTTGTKYASKTTTTGTKYATGTSTTKTVYATTSSKTTFSVPSLKSVLPNGTHSVTSMQGVSFTDAGYGTAIKISTYGSQTQYASNPNIATTSVTQAIKNNSVLLLKDSRDVFVLNNLGTRWSYTSTNGVMSSGSYTAGNNIYWNNQQSATLTAKSSNKEFPWSTNTITFNQTITLTSGNTKSTYVSFRMVNYTIGQTYTANEYFPSQASKKYTLTPISLISASGLLRATSESTSSSNSYAKTTNTLYSTKTVTSTPITYQTTTRTTTPLTYQTTTKTSTPVTYLTKTVTSTPITYSTKTVTSTPITYSTKTVTSTPITYNTKTVTSTPITYNTKTVTSTPITYNTTNVTTGYSGKVSSGSSWTAWG